MTSLPHGERRMELPASHYDQVYAAHPKYGHGWQRHPARHVCWYPALVLARPPVFDIGCGPGQVAEMCRDMGIEYAGGLDYSEVAVDMARKRCPGQTFMVHDARKPLPPTKLFNTALILEVLEHVYLDLRVLGNVPLGCRVVASVPSFHTEGHVRWFSSAKEVVERYRPLLEVDTVITETAASGNRWFVFRGVRR